MHKSMLGKIGPGSADVTLGDYITRKQQAAAFDAVAKEDKVKQLEWCRQMFDDAKHNAWPDRLQVVFDQRGNGVIRGWGSELVLLKDGRWFMSDTSGA